MSKSVEFQEFTKTTVLPTTGDMNSPLVFPAFALAGEVGEIVNYIKKMVRDRDGCTTAYDESYLCLELGDCLWYIAVLADRLGLTMDDLMNANMRKLSKRYKAVGESNV